MPDKTQSTENLIRQNEFLPQKLKALYLQLLPHLSTVQLRQVQTLFLGFSEEQADFNEEVKQQKQIYLKSKLEVLNTFLKQERNRIREYSEGSNFKKDQSLEEELLAEINKL